MSPSQASKQLPGCTALSVSKVCRHPSRWCVIDVLGILKAGGLQKTPSPMAARCVRPVAVLTEFMRGWSDFIAHHCFVVLATVPRTESMTDKS